MALGLERVREVWQRMGRALACARFVVGGTNGKGSTAAMLDAMLRAAGYRVGLYTSPHLLRYNERVRIQGAEVDDALLCDAFAAVEVARGVVPLTYFEYGTLAAGWLFAREGLDAAVLEVGLGGRLDAVNLFDADCAVLTSVALDHLEYLGDTRESIGYEKAGIFRAGRPAVLADPDPPLSVLREAERIGAELLRIGRDFGFENHGAQWSFWGRAGKRGGLAHPALRGSPQLRNAAAAIAALGTLSKRLPVGVQEMRNGLARVALPGRFEVLPGRPRIILDVAHNAEAAAVLARDVAALGLSPRTIAVFGMLRDKDMAAVARALAPVVSSWHVAGLPGPRGAGGAELAAVVAALGGSVAVRVHVDPATAFSAAREEAGEDDKILVFGSFLTVADVMAKLDPRSRG